MDACKELESLRFYNPLSGKTTTGADVITWLENKPNEQELADYLKSDARYFEILLHIDDLDHDRKDNGKFGREIKKVLIRKYGISEEEINSALEEAYVTFYRNTPQGAKYSAENIIADIKAIWKRIRND